MSNPRWRVAGLAEPRAAWFSDMSRWSTEAAIPVDFVKCLSAEEVRTRLVVGEAFSALLVGSGAAGVDLSLTAEARDRGLTVIGIGESAANSWSELGVSAVLEEGFQRDDLIAALAAHAPVHAESAGNKATASRAQPGGWLGQLVCVTGAGGTGSSLLAMCLAAELARDASNRGLVLLADLALNADQAMMHDSRDVIPGVQDLLEAFAEGRTSRELVRSVVFEPEGRGYDLLLGLRRHRDWVTVRRRSLEGAMDVLLRTYRYVVADVDADAEGVPETGSADVENRNLMARTALLRADLVVVVGTAGTKGLCSLVRTIEALADAGVDADRLLAVLNRLGRKLSHRQAAASAVAPLLENTRAQRLGSPVLVGEARSVETALRDGVVPPRSLVRPLAAQVRHRLHPVGRQTAGAEIGGADPQGMAAMAGGTP